MMDSISRLVEEAERLDTDMAIEPVYWHPLENLEVTAEVFDRIDNSRHLKMIFDPANVLPEPEIDQDAYWKEWLSVLERRGRGHPYERFRRRSAERILSGMPGRGRDPICRDYQMAEEKQAGHRHCPGRAGPEDRAERSGVDAGSVGEILKKESMGILHQGSAKCMELI